ncbi:hypothetical protein D915_004272 [Fasciola hepatica]|uniref:Uncharacterized protein n=1 Tax=Fasciola hepatica TaxID=6192 RepID=A0A4E0RZS3_FASHE|nr:hypothetical protein D915_004272 [Fasciola hepatica]
MGRGGARAKAGGGTLTGDGPLNTQSLSLNLTLFQFLQTGYFEKDLLSYCANRLAEYSCIYWLSPNVDDETETVELHTAAYRTETVRWTTPVDAEFTKYPSQFINLDRDKPKGVTVVQTLTDGQPITGTFLGPINVREFVLTEHGISVAVVESHRLPLDAVARIILPFLLLIACLCNLFILKAAYKLSRRRLPLAIYLVYIATLDQIDLFARGTDYLVEAYGGIRLFTAVQFIDRSACQLLTMIHSGLRHLHASLLVGFAIDTLRFTCCPSAYAAVYRREWTRNVLILSAVLAITIDSQFLWTFDLSLLHTKTLHKRVVRKACECGFSTTTTLSPLFLNVIWPLIDHMWTEIIPFAACGFLGTSTLLILRLRRRCQISVSGRSTLPYVGKIHRSQTTRDMTTDGATDFAGYFKAAVYRWFDGHTIHEAPKAYGLVIITDCLFIVPRAIYYLTKYAMFSNFDLNRDGLQFSSEDEQSEHPNLVAILNAIRRADRLRPYEVPLEGVEAVIRYLSCVHVICRAAVLIHNMTALRKQIVIHWRRIERVLHWSKRRSITSPRVTCLQVNERSTGSKLSPKTTESIHLDQSTTRKVGSKRGINGNGNIKTGLKEKCIRGDEIATGITRSETGEGESANLRTHTMNVSDRTEQVSSSRSVITKPRALLRNATNHVSKSFSRSVNVTKSNADCGKPRNLVNISKPTKQLYSL